jgi:CheY-like chemotaxis protein
MDGFEVARWLRQQDGPRAALLVAVTGYGQEHDLERCREAGFDHHLLKPFGPRELERLLAEFAEARPRPMRTAERRSTAGKPTRAGLLELALRIHRRRLVQYAKQLFQCGDALRAKSQRLLCKSAGLRRLSLFPFPWPRPGGQALDRHRG